MKNKGFINPYLSLFILAGLLVTVGGFAAYNTYTTPKNVLGETTTLPPWMPNLKYKRVNVMQTLDNQSVPANAPKYYDNLAKGYVFKAKLGQKYEILAEEYAETPHIKTYLFDKNGTKLLEGGTQLLITETANINRRYDGDYYVVVTTTNPDYRDFKFSVTDRHQIDAVLRVRDITTGKVYKVTEEQYMDPTYVIPATVTYANLIIDYNGSRDDYNWVNADRLMLHTLSGSWTQHIGQYISSDPTKFLYAESAPFPQYKAQHKPLVASSYGWDALLFSSEERTEGLDYYPSIMLLSRTQHSITTHSDTPSSKVLRFWTE